jgi:hypothetical protein
LVIPKCWNIITTLCYVQSQKIAGLKACSISVCPSIRKTKKWRNINVFCDITSEKIYCSKIRLHARSINWSCSIYSTPLLKVQNFLHL